MSIVSAGNIPGLQDLIRRFEQREGEAREANERRYEQTLGDYRRQGFQSKADVRRGVAEEQAQNMQQLISQGLGSSTVLQSLNTRTAERGARESARIDEAVAGNLARVRESRYDEYPDLNSIADLIAQLTAARGSQQRSHTVVGGAPSRGRGGRRILF